MENHIKMDDLGVPLFSETSICMGSIRIGTYGNLHEWLICMVKKNKLNIPVPWMRHGIFS